MSTEKSDDGLRVYCATHGWFCMDDPCLCIAGPNTPTARGSKCTALVKGPPRPLRLLRRVRVPRMRLVGKLLTEAEIERMHAALVKQS